MNFISIAYIVFFIVVAFIYFRLPQQQRWILLLVASYFFYAYWEVTYLILIVFSTFVDYFVARLIGATPQDNQVRRRALITISLLINLGTLFVFKYFNFFADSLNDLLIQLGLNTNLATLEILLPVGISFYTFQSMSYTIDVYRGHIQPEKHFGVFATYIAFFPQLVAGPIERAGNMLPQFFEDHRFDYARIVSGLRLMLWGAFKKVVIADRIAEYVNTIYGRPEDYTGTVLILGTLLFAFQIYCDFSGYSDIAIGTARIFGFDLMTNFRQPYLSRSFREFWRRWHISLSTWFRDYVYIPLGGNRVPFSRNILNLLIVFVVSGLWHGANWTFAIWGAIHGLVLAFEATAEHFQISLLPKQINPTIRNTIALGITFTIVCIAWVFFRANNVSDAIYIVTHLFHFGANPPIILANGHVFNAYDLITSFGLIAFLIITEWAWNQETLIKPRHITHYVRQFGYALMLGLIIATYLSNVNASENFIYFQF